eukprot:14415-Alexandrium_andersonii.AAC.1
MSRARPHLRSTQRLGDLSSAALWLNGRAGRATREIGRWRISASRLRPLSRPGAPLGPGK